MKAKCVTYTSSLPALIMNELSEYAEKHQIKKNEIIKDAITTFLKEKRKQEYASSFQRMKGDNEQYQLAEAGLGDFKRAIDEYEN